MAARKMQYGQCIRACRARSQAVNALRRRPYPKVSTAINIDARVARTVKAVCRERSLQVVFILVPLHEGGVCHHPEIPRLRFIGQI